MTMITIDIRITDLLKNRPEGMTAREMIDALYQGQEAVTVRQFVPTLTRMVMMNKINTCGAARSPTYFVPGAGRALDLSESMRERVDVHGFRPLTRPIQPQPPREVPEWSKRPEGFTFKSM